MDKAFWKSKGMLLGLATIVLGALEQFQGLLTDMGAGGWVIMGIGVLIGIIRSVTKQPVGLTDG